MRLARRAVTVIPYRARPWLRRLPLLSRAADRLFPSGERELVQVRGGPLDGLWLELDLGSEGALWAGTYEPEVQRALSDLVEEGMVAWDLGAHVGFFSLLLARRCSRVVAVEADPGNAERLRRHVALNQAPVEVVEAAVWSHSGTVPFQLLREPARNRVATGEAARSTIVRAMTLTEIGEAYGRPDIVKMDVEGAELAAFAAVGDALDATRAIVVEVHEGCERGTRAALDRLGFRVAELTTGPAARLVGRRGLAG